MRRRAAAKPGQHCRAARCRSSAASTIGLLAPLVVHRKGVYTELADWARPRGYTHLRVDGAFLPTTGFPRLDRFKEHSIELPVASVLVTRRQTRRTLRQHLAQALETGQGRGAGAAAASTIWPSRAWGRVATAVAWARVQVFSTQRACPVCATSYAELEPRLFSYNSKHGWCPDCVGTGVQLTKDAAQGRTTTASWPKTTAAAKSALPAKRWKTWRNAPAPAARARA